MSDAATDTNYFFRPRRLGHANLFVDDYAGSFDFYYEVAGIEEAYRQPDNNASFISNGNTYHDVGLTDTKSKYNKSHRPPGLFHLALEVETEVDLVDGYNKAIASGVAFSYTRDHDVAHSLYKHDPDGNMVEIYADVMSDWREHRSGIVTKPKPDWIPGVTTVPLSEKLYPIDPELHIVKEAVFHTKRVTHIALVAVDYPAMFRYYTDIVGLTPMVGDAESRYAVLTGTCGNGAITLLRQQPGMIQGLHHTGYEVWSEDDLEQSLQKLLARGMKPIRDIDHPARRAISINDPSGLVLQFYVNRDFTPAAMATADEETATWLF